MDTLNDGKNFEGYKNVFGSAEKAMVHNTDSERWHDMQRLICHKISVSYCMTYFLNQDTKIEYSNHLTKSIKTIAHYMQNGIENRFQEWSDSYMKDDGARVTEEVPLSEISEMPVYLYIAEKDLLCKKEQALWISDQIGEAIREVRVFEDQGHEFFINSSDFILAMSLLYTLKIDEDAIVGDSIHEHWQAWEINHEIGFAPVYNHNNVEMFDTQ